VLKKQAKLSEQIRAAVDSSGLSRYRICKLLKIAQSTFSRFMAGGGLGMDNLDGLADLLGLKIIVTKKAIGKSEKG
jgi:hypothetical protein